jgi:hypothetical protein
VRVDHGFHTRSAIAGNLLESMHSVSMAGNCHTHIWAPMTASASDSGT